MMKRIVTVLLVLCMIIGLVPALSGCSPSQYDSLPDSYNAETDYSYTFSSFFFGKAMTSEEDGYYFRLGDFLFYMDAESKEVVPLCNRPDCQHLKEKSPSEVWKCNAYMGQTMFSQIQYYDAKLYCTSSFSKEKAVSSLALSDFLTEVSADSAYRETIAPIKSGTGSSAFYIHRGYLYTALSSTEADGKTPRFELNRVSLEKVGKEEPEVLFEGAFSGPYTILYGNHFYLGAHVEEEESSDTYTLCTYDYNIKTKQVKLITKGKYPVGIIDGKLLLRRPIYDEEPTEAQAYLYDPGTEQETDYLTIPKTEGMASTLDTDGTYLYFLEGSMEAESGDLGEWNLCIFNLKGECINKQDLGFLPATINFVPGDDRYAFIYSEMYGEKERYKAVTILDKQDNFSYETVCKYDESLLHPKVSMDLSADS